MRGAVNQVAPVREGGHEGDGEPVARRFAEAGLVLHVVRQVGQGIALGGAALVGDGFIASGEGNGLIGKERNLLGGNRSSTGPTHVAGRGPGRSSPRRST